MLINGTWNSYRIEAIGNQIKSFINGIEISNLIDETTLKGFIAFQVHSISNSDQVGKKYVGNVRYSQKILK